MATFKRSKDASQYVEAIVHRDITAALTETAREELDAVIAMSPKDTGSYVDAYSVAPAKAVTDRTRETKATIANSRPYATFVKLDNGQTAIEFLDGRIAAIGAKINQKLRNIS